MVSVEFLYRVVRSKRVAKLRLARVFRFYSRRDRNQKRSKHAYKLHNLHNLLQSDHCLADWAGRVEGGESRSR
jgi:hypothetical protein